MVVHLAALSLVCVYVCVCVYTLQHSRLSLAHTQADRRILQRIIKLELYVVRPLKSYDILRLKVSQ